MFKAHAPSSSQRQLLQPAQRNKETSLIALFPSERASFPVCLVACSRLWSVRHVIRLAQLVVDVILRLPCSFNHAKPLGQVMLSNFTAVRHAGQELQKPLYKLSKLRKQNSCRQEGKRYGPAIPQREKKQWRQFCTFDVVIPQMEEKQWRSRFLLVVLVIVHVMENSDNSYF